MTQLIADRSDIDFTLYEQFRAEDLFGQPRSTSFSRKIFDMILSETRKLAVKVILPTLAEGD